ncbi:MAG: prephenate dehydrogenase/arogenate dehydrogenase family protein [Chloroflexota bacterium]|nr:MAG: prephenate dehydrogenase/arogenate dehydrogenase family protein [Chloroflexota bacterium]
MKAQTAGIIGLEKVSASVGMALRAADIGLEVIGTDRDRAIIREAVEIGALDKGTRRPLEVARVSDIVILSAPVAEMDATLEIVGSNVREHTLIVDMSALKGRGLKLAEQHLHQGHYIGISPVLTAAALADGRADIGAARADLFADSVFCIMPSGTADPEAVTTTVNLGRILGATPFFLDPYEYDSLMLGVETTPALVGAALFRAVTQASGWRDMLRFAGSSFAMSTAGLESENLGEMAYHDKAATLRWLDSVLEELQELRRWLADEDQERVSLILEEMAMERQRWLHERQENNWVEIEKSDELGSIGVAGQLFGFGSRKKAKK